ncbi:CopG family transcriptional regulator [Candidatus Pacearchaeota archaeon]|nr:CopG family transcriptional regulator [Candidatus Pacearchaeota archaeon]
MKTNVTRSTIYLDSDLHHALKVKALQTHHSMSDLVNEAIKYALKEDIIDIAAYKNRKNEPVVEFGKVLKKLEQNGKI